MGKAISLFFTLSQTFCDLHFKPLERSDLILWLAAWHTMAQTFWSQAGGILIQYSVNSSMQGLNLD